MPAPAEPLPSWNDTPTRRALFAFVADVTHTGGARYVPPEERVAVFDNDGTLWCEKPMPVELGFLLERFAAMASASPALRAREPWRAASANDHAWLASAIDAHYAGDDTRLQQLAAGAVDAFSGWAVEDYASAADTFVRDRRNPLFDRPFSDCGYPPMVELLRFLEANGFSNYIASGGDRDFMRTFAWETFRVPPERIIGSSTALRYSAARRTVVYDAKPDVFDDGPAKPVRIWSRIGRRPILAAGNSNGDLPMLEVSRSLRLLVHHDDARREIAYTTGAEHALETARSRGWLVASIQDDWSTVFSA